MIASALSRSLREALRLGQFEPALPGPIPASGNVNGLEALMRWRHPRRGLVPPSIFLSVAEETDIIVPLGRWSIQAACEQLAKWKADPQLGKLPICVNISAKQLRQADLAEQVQDIISQTGADPALLLLELSTQALSPSHTDIVPNLTRLRTMGLRLSLDDFGDSSHMQQALQQLPLNQAQALALPGPAPGPQQCRRSCRAGGHRAGHPPSDDDSRRRSGDPGAACPAGAIWLRAFHGLSAQPSGTGRPGSGRCCSGRSYPACRKLQLDDRVSAMKKASQCEAFWHFTPDWQALTAINQGVHKLNTVAG